MATKSDHRFKMRLAHVVAVIVFALAQLATVAHAEGDHEAHTSTVSCAICCFAVADDDVDAPPPAVYSVILTQRLDHNRSVSVARIPVAKFDLHSIARGPPYN